MFTLPFIMKEACTCIASWQHVDSNELQNKDLRIRLHTYEIYVIVVCSNYRRIYDEYYRIKDP